MTETTPARTAARLLSVVLDTPNPQALAKFYAELLGSQARADDDNSWAEVTLPAGGLLSFQLAPGLQPASWPDSAVPQQFHLDIAVDDLDNGEQHALSLGAIRKAIDGERSSSFRVFIDPSGHPFCLCVVD